jgi:putative ABC transport system permease protein
LNILGLAVAFAVFFAIIVQTYYDFSFDKTFKKSDNIYLCTWNSTTQTGREIAAKFPEIKNFCYTNPLTWTTYVFEVKDSHNNMHEYTEKAIRVSEGFIDMFMPGKIIIGDATQVFTSDNKVMLTESIAKKFFGNEDPLGKVVDMHYSRHNVLVSVVAVCKDFPDNCSFQNGVYMMAPYNDPSSSGYYVYVEIAPENKDKLLKNLNEENEEMKRHFNLIALTDIYLKSPLARGNISATLSLLLVGLWLMIIAYINFINFSMSMAPVRLKSLNIRRIMGENPLFLKISIAMESVFISFIAFLVSILFIMYLNTGVIEEFFHVDLSLSANINPLLLTAAASLAMGFVAGLYPALYSTRFRPAVALSGSFFASKGNKILKNSLIVIQFISTVFFIITAYFIKIQHDYMQNTPWGIDKENVVYIDIAYMVREFRKSFEIELGNNPDIFNIARLCTPPGQLGGSLYLQCKIGEVDVNEYVRITSSNILDFFDIPLVEGRHFEDEDIYGGEKIIVNQSFAKKYGFNEKDITGIQFPSNQYFPGGTSEIVGVMKDFNIQSLKYHVEPLVFAVGKAYTDWYSPYMLIKFNGQNRHKAIEYIDKTWKKYCNAYLDIHFLDEELGNLYEKENNLAKLISICGLITLIVAIMGVYGLILFNVKSKRKTIALHKINGASVKDVILMLNRGFIIQFVIAYLVAVPLAYIVVNRWLENFAYKTPIHWWVFVAGGLLVFVIMALTVSYQSYKAATANPIDGIKTE